MADIGTADSLLIAAQNLIQERGFNAFSYRDLAEAVGIRAASIHYHFPTKTDLGVALVERYRAGFRGVTDALTAEGLPPGVELEKYIGVLTEAVDRGQRRCICGVLGAEMSTLEAPLRKEVAGFFLDNEAYLARLLKKGVDSGEFRLSAPAGTTAKAVFAILQGGMLAACVFGTIDRFSAVADFVQQAVVGNKK